MEVYERIRALRQERGILAKDVAEQIGVAASTYSLLESGKRRLAAIHVEKIARTLRMSVAELYGEAPPFARSRRSVAAGKSSRAGKHLRSINTPELRKKLLPILGDLTEEVIEYCELSVVAPMTAKRALKTAEDAANGSGRPTDGRGGR